MSDVALAPIEGARGTEHEPQSGGCTWHERNRYYCNVVLWPVLLAGQSRYTCRQLREWEIAAKKRQVRQTGAAGLEAQEAGPVVQEPRHVANA